ncbi:MAG TPA: hypothetical protein VMH22_00525 [bacterium]|nr:hypothetical protein [bacterium]
MSTFCHLRRLVLPVVVVFIGGMVVSCNSRTVHQAEQVASEEAAYAALQSALSRAGITSAGSITDALRSAVEKRDFGGAAAALTVALNEHNIHSTQKLTSAQAIGLMRQAIPTVRNISPKVGSGLQSFCDYASGKH